MGANDCKMILSGRKEIAVTALKTSLRLFSDHCFGRKEVASDWIFESKAVARWSQAVASHSVTGPLDLSLVWRPQK